MSQQKSKKTLINWDLVTVNPNNKDWNWSDLFCYWGVTIQSVMGFSLIASLYVIYDLNTFVVFFGTILGSILVYIFSNLIGKPSQKFGLPFVVLLRSSLGVNGAKYFGLLRCLVGIFMFGIQTYFLSKIFGYLIRIFLFSIEPSILDENIFLIFFLGLGLIDWFSITVSIIFQTLLFSAGMIFNKKIIKFSAISVYFGLLLFFFSVLLSDVKFTTSAFLDVLDLENFVNENNLGPLATVTGTIFAYFSIVILTFGDFSRYVKNENELKKGNLSLLLNIILFSFLSILIVLGVDIIFAKQQIEINQLLTNPTDIIGKLNNTFLTIVALVFILFASSSTNLIANYIPTQNVLINFFPKKLSLKSSGFLIILFGFFIGLFWLPILSKVGILSFIDTIGAFLGPIFGIMIADYYLIQNKKIINKDIFSSAPNSAYYYSNGWQIKGLYSLVIGFVFSSSTIWNTKLLFLQSYSWLIGAIISFIVYYLLKSE